MRKKAKDSSFVSHMNKIEKSWNDVCTAVESYAAINKNFSKLIKDEEHENKQKI